MNITPDYRPHGRLARLERVIRKGGGDWQTHLHAGMCWSELAESAWMVGHKGWKERAGNFAIKADACFLLAAKRMPVAEQEVSLQEINLLRLLNQMRISRLVKDETKRLLEIHQALVNIRLRLDAQRIQRAGNSAVWRQLAICDMLLSRLAWGGKVGLGIASQQEAAREYARLASTHFGQAGSQQDNGAAQRDFFCWTALAFRSNGDNRNARRWAVRAYISAREHHARGDQLRAMTILRWGWRGERWLRLLRDWV